MRTTITLDDELLAKASKLAGSLDRSTVVSEGLKAFIERESACGTLADRQNTLELLQDLPFTAVAQADDVLGFIARRGGVPAPDLVAGEGLRACKPEG